MRRILFLFWGVLTFLLVTVPAESQTTTSSYAFTCISGCGSALESYNASALTIGALVSVGGFHTANDSGGGNFVVLGQQDGTTPGCVPFSDTGATGTGVGQTEIDFSTNAHGLAVGALVSGSGASGSFVMNVPPGAEIAKIIGSGMHETGVKLTLPLTGTASGSLTMSISISGSNGGTLLLDATPTPLGGPNCYQKTNYRGDPREWGAYSNDNTPADETVTTAALLNWLGAPGPWDATTPATYYIDGPLICWPGVHIRAPAIDTANSSGSLVSVMADNPTGSTWTTGGYMFLMESTCRDSGLALDAGTLGSGSSLQLNTVEIDSTNLAQLYIGAATIYRPEIDSHTNILDGFHNVYCPTASGAIGSQGLRISDVTISQSYDSDVELDHCNNVKMSNDLVTGAGANNSTPNVAAGIVFQQSADFNLWNTTIQQSQGPGLKLAAAGGTAAYQGSITGNFFDSNGENDTSTGGGAGIELDGAVGFAICGNHFNRNDSRPSGSGYYSAHVRFGGTGSPSNQRNMFCGNTYYADTSHTSGSVVPDFAYDISGGTSGTVDGSNSLYETPSNQNVGIFSGESAALMPLQIAYGTAPNYLTGLILSNDSTNGAIVHIAPGNAADSTNKIAMNLTASCPVNLGATGASGIDQSYPNLPGLVTLYYYIIAGPNATTSCIASEGLPFTGPVLPAGYTYYRAVGVLYNDSTTVLHVVQFNQNDDNFYLNTSVAFSGTATAAATNNLTISSIPQAAGIEAFGRCSATSAVMLTGGPSPSQAAITSMGTAPGYAVDIAAPNSTYTFTLYARPAISGSIGGTITATTASPSPPTTATCMNDGWTWHRGR